MARAAFALALLLSVTLGQAAPRSPARVCLVVGVADGDTLTARCGAPSAYEQVKVRISAIDAPEKRQPFGQRSRQSLSALCFKVEARITERDRDRYGRTVADVECGGEDVAEHQVRSGMAWVYERYARGYEGLRPLQDVARDGRLGLWVDREPVAPWEWRAAKRSAR